MNIQEKHSEVSLKSKNLVAEDFQTWRKIISESFVPLVMQSFDPVAFKARIRSKTVGGISISLIEAKAHTVERTPDLISKADRHYFKLSLQLSGTGIFIQDNREATLVPGDMAIYGTDRPYTLAFGSDFKALVFMVPQSAIDLPKDVIGRLTATKIAGDSGIAKIIGPFLTQLAVTMDDITGHSGVRVMINAVDIVTTLLHSELDHANVDITQGRRASLVQDIRSYIDDHLGDCNLDPNSIAAANFISTRHLHGIFKEEGVTVSAWIRSRRLEHCRRDILDPLYISKPISWIAHRWGFVDPSHFSRLFRSTYGEAPTDLRNRTWPEAVNH